MPRTRCTTCDMNNENRAWRYGVFSASPALASPFCSAVWVNEHKASLSALELHKEEDGVVVI